MAKKTSETIETIDDDFTTVIRSIEKVAEGKKTTQLLVGVTFKTNEKSVKPRVQDNKNYSASDVLSDADHKTLDGLLRKLLKHSHKRQGFT